MSRARHKARGGKTVVYAGEGSNVIKDARERKFGGRIEGEGAAAKARSDKKGRARGGAVPARAAGGAVSAAGASVPGRKRGGGIGSNLKPLSTAANTKKMPVEEAGTESIGRHRGDNVPNP